MMSQHAATCLHHLVSALEGIPRGVKRPIFRGSDSSFKNRNQNQNQNLGQLTQQKFQNLLNCYELWYISIPGTGRVQNSIAANEDEITEALV